MQDLNLRPLGPKPSALPNCANRRHIYFEHLNFELKTTYKKVVGDAGFEPATPWTQTKCATKLR